MTLADRINTQLAALNLLPLTSGQIECLQDPFRIQEAADMLDDLAARCGVRLPPPEGTEKGPLGDEDEARTEAEGLVDKYAVVWLDVAASDDGRSLGANEYYVTGFDGPEAALALATRDRVIACWVNGQEQE